MLKEKIRNTIPKKVQGFLIVVSLLGIICGILLFIPHGRVYIISEIQNSHIYSQIISYIEVNIVHHKLNPDYINRHWDDALFALGGDLLLVFFAVLFFTQRFVQFCTKVSQQLISGIIRLKTRLGITYVWNSKKFIAIFCGFLGAVFFLHTFGIAVLDFTYTDWAMNGFIDLTQHYTGWCFYRNSAWHFPFGLMDNIIYPFKESIIYTDSIPLFAVIFKVLSPILPATFQYFGLFGLVVYIVQGALAGLIIKRITGNTLPAILASVFFLLSTPMFYYIFHATSLSAHFIILFCIYTCITKDTMRSIPKNTCLWGGLFFLAATIHMYFVPIVGIFMIFYLLDDYLKTKKIFPQVIIGTISFLVLLVTMFLFGAFYSHANVAIGGTVGGANINVLLNPMYGISKYLKDLPVVPDADQWAGFAYAGLGLILGILLILVISSKKINQIHIILSNQIIKQKVMLIIGMLLTFFWLALSPTITINDHVIFKYYIPVVNIFFEIFRAPGRMMWPILYTIICFVVWRITREYRGKTGVVILALFLIIQYADLSNYITGKGATFKQRAEWKTELPSNTWNMLGTKYRHIVFLGEIRLEDNSSRPNMKLFSFHNLAIKYNLTTNDSYLARKNDVLIAGYKEEEKKRIYNSEAGPDSIYVFETWTEAEPFEQYLHLQMIDNIIIGNTK